MDGKHPKERGGGGGEVQTSQTLPKVPRPSTAPPSMQESSWACVRFLRWPRSGPAGMVDGICWWPPAISSRASDADCQLPEGTVWPQRPGSLSLVSTCISTACEMALSVSHAQRMRCSACVTAAPSQHGQLRSPHPKARICPHARPEKHTSQSCTMSRPSTVRPHQLKLAPSKDASLQREVHPLCPSRSPLAVT